MKKLSLFFIVSTLGALLMNSCSIERRYHRTGFNVNWKNTSVNIKKTKTKSDFATEELQEDLALIRKVENNLVAKSEVALNSNEIIVTQTNSVYEAVENSSDIATNNDEMVFNQKINHDAVQVEKVISENKSVSKISKKDILKHAKAIKKAVSRDVPVVLLYILCFFIYLFIPWLAVGLVTDWDIKKVLINILLTLLGGTILLTLLGGIPGIILRILLGGIPGIIHAIIVVYRNN